ncbi:hypothetical protein ACFXKF_36405 [Streptomyces scopuliridis]|uniref:hypothetical protein n=1 Tax=Streptomyces scopuliridis TaxID=452529 RepID=UPI0036A904FF
MAETWYRTYGRGRIDIPCGVVAALALWPHKSAGASHAPDLARYFISQPATRWPPTVGQVAAVHWLRRPDLISVAGPMLRWYQEDLSDDTLYAIKAVADTALKHGVLLHTGDTDPYMRSHIDVMSWTLVCLRHREDRSWLAEHHTPDDVADLLVSLGIGDDPPPAASLHEPAGGTGNIFRAVAQHLRERGIDPGGWTWSLQDLDPLAVAAAAVNFLVWELGPGANACCGNTLSEGDLTGRALALRAEAEDRRRALLTSAEQGAAFLRAMRSLGIAS